MNHPPSFIERSFERVSKSPPIRKPNGDMKKHTLQNTKEIQSSSTSYPNSCWIRITRRVKPTFNWSTRQSVKTVKRNYMHQMSLKTFTTTAITIYHQPSIQPTLVKQAQIILRLSPTPSSRQPKYSKIALVRPKYFILNVLAWTSTAIKGCRFWKEIQRKIMLCT